MLPDYKAKPKSRDQAVMAEDNTEGHDRADEGLEQKTSTKQENLDAMRPQRALRALRALRTLRHYGNL